MFRGAWGPLWGSGEPSPHGEVRNKAPGSLLGRLHRARPRTPTKSRQLRHHPPCRWRRVRGEGRPTPRASRDGAELGALSIAARRCTVPRLARRCRSFGASETVRSRASPGDSSGPRWAALNSAGLAQLLRTSSRFVTLWTKSGLSLFNFVGGCQFRPHWPISPEVGQHRPNVGGTGLGGASYTHSFG